MDESHPTLALDWSGRTLGDMTLGAEFQDWMRKQNKRSGEPYSANTIAAYAAALKNATAKLRLGVEVCHTLFRYTSQAQFEAARQLIAASPRLAEIDQVAGNNAYSSGIALYARFLSDYESAAYWIFQGNPKYYDLERVITQDTTITWTVNQAHRQIKKGDTVYIWLSGEHSGILASGVILCDPEKRDPGSQETPQYQGGVPKTAPFLAVDVLIRRRLEAVIPRQLFLEDARTQRLGVLTFPGVTNYGVTKEQAAVIESAFSGRYRQVPAVTDSPGPGTSVRYWIYAPGESPRFWEEFRSLGLMGIRWDALGDFSQYASKAAVSAAVNQLWHDGKNHRNDTLSVWQFRSVLKPRDIVYVKQGPSGIVARGIVAGDYAHQLLRTEYKNVRRVNWTHIKSLDAPPQLKSCRGILGEISRHTDVIRLLETDFGAGEEELRPFPSHPPYTREDFLREVYLSAAQYDTLSGLLLRKKTSSCRGLRGGKNLCGGEALLLPYGGAGCRPGTHGTVSSELQL